MIMVCQTEFSKGEIPCSKRLDKYLRREQEREFMQKTRCLMENDVSFQMFQIQLSFTSVGSESQVSVDQVTL